MSSDLQRQDSLRTVLRNQKRRLSATERKQSSPDLTGGNGERKSPFSLRSTPSRSHRGTPTKSERGTPTRSTCTPPRLSKYIKRAINSLIMSGLVIQLFAWGTLGGGQAFDWCVIGDRITGKGGWGCLGWDRKKNYTNLIAPPP